jgi:hypothetical protein
LPKLLKEEDVHAEYPSDTDDEYVTEKGFQPTLPGEYTKLSSALALFRAVRILGKVLEKVYPSATAHELSLQQLQALERELDDWKESLPPHLRLTFAQDKPSTDVTGSRSPLLSLAYYYIRTLIYRPAVGSSLGPKAVPALISVGDSAKHTIQIIELLEERSMTMSFCLNKTDVLVVCGMTLLYQILELKQDSKLSKDAQKLVNGVVRMLTKAKAVGSLDFKRIAGMLMAIDEPALPSPPQQSPVAASMPAPTRRNSPPAGLQRKKSYPPQPSLGRLSAASISEMDLRQQQEKLRRMTMPVPDQRPDVYRVQGRRSLDNPTDQLAGRREQRLSASQAAALHRASPGPQRHSLDYLSLSGTPAQSQGSPQLQTRLQQLASTPHLTELYSTAQLQQKLSGVSAAEWEAILGSMDGGQVNVYDAIYGGPGLSMTETPISTTSTAGWSPDSWDLTNFNLGDFGSNPAPPQSVLSMSDESLSSGEEVAPSELGLSVGSGMDYPNGILAPCAPGGDSFIIDGLVEANFM